MESAYAIGGNTLKEGSYDRSVDYILDKDYDSLYELSLNPDFISFIEETLTASFNTNIEFNPPANGALINTPLFSFTQSGNTLAITAPVFVYQIDNTPSVPDDNDFTERTYNWIFLGQSAIFFRDFAVSSSCKTNRSYAVGILYMDSSKRKTTVITGKRILFIFRRNSA